MSQTMRWASLVFMVLSTAHAQRTGFSGNTCPDSCPDSNQPVCGTNNRVYRNLCVLQRAACNSDIRKKNDGPCISSSSSCDKRCSSAYEPVCATNGQTYDNKCKLSIATCNNPNIKQRFVGVCDIPVGSSSGDSTPSVGTIAVRPSQELAGSSSSSSSSSNNPPKRPGVIGGLLIGAPVRPFASSNQNTPQQPVATAAPVVNTPRPERNCPSICDAGFRPVCGTDGQVYGNICKLRVAICKNPRLALKNEGVCEKDCSIQCPLDISYVCGNNDRTYVNECELVVARCKDPAITKKHDGPCVGIRDTECRPANCDRAVNPVCGSDGNTYANICQLRNQACYDDSLLKLRDGPCQAQKCREACPALNEPVCGTDGVTYPNHCILINEACKSRSDVVRAYDGNCRRRPRPNRG